MSEDLGACAYMTKLINDARMPNEAGLTLSRVLFPRVRSVSAQQRHVFEQDLERNSGTLCQRHAPIHVELAMLFDRMILKSSRTNAQVLKMSVISDRGEETCSSLCLFKSKPGGS